MLISYAGIKVDEQNVIGDRNNVEFTEVNIYLIFFCLKILRCQSDFVFQICMRLGWKPKLIEFEILPLVLQASGQEPEYFEIPSDLAYECEFVHPK